MNSRRGFALVLAVIALAALGLVVMSSFVLSARESELGTSAFTEVGQRAAAEAAVAEGFRGWQRDLTPWAAGDSIRLAEVELPGSGGADLFLKALGGPLFALHGRARGGSAVELLVRIDSSGTDSLYRPQTIARGWRAVP